MREEEREIEIDDKLISIEWIRKRANKKEFQLTGHAHKERQEEVIKTKEIRGALIEGEILENKWINERTRAKRGDNDVA